MTFRAVLAAAIPLVFTAANAAAAEHAFAEISGHYEAIRQALIQDSDAGVTEHARAIEAVALRLSTDFSAAAAGVADSDAQTVREVLPEVIDCARNLAAAAGVAGARADFANLTKPLVRYHALVQGARPMVVYCPMERKSWLQPDGPVGNPYAPSMLRCGEVVAR